MGLTRAALAAALALTARAAFGAETGPLVRVDAGVLQGAAAAGVVSFKGVPYARPPVGPLRWRAPQRAEAWRGVRPATAYGAVCMQKPSKDNGVGPGPISEDCLTLNVFAPEGRAPKGGWPILVWIHGGGLVNGSGTAALYDGSGLARQGLIVVTLNYRLGRFGFFAHPALTREAPTGLLANYGFMDQIEALKWVRRNARAFGGDPSKVAIYGESAGGMSVNRLMSSPQAKGLFSKAMVSSGLGREPFLTLKAAEANGQAFAASIHAADADAAALRSIPADVILAAGDPGLDGGEASIIDGRVVTESVMAAFKAGHEADVPYLVGSNSVEFPPSLVAGRLKSLLGEVKLDPAAAVRVYGSKEAYDQTFGRDVVFSEPARTLAALHARRGAATFLYRFDVYPTSSPFKGAAHAQDRQYVFKTLAASPFPTDERDKALAETISAYFASFARTGDPNSGPGGAASAADRPPWPSYGPGDQVMIFTNDGPKPGATPQAAALDLIAEAYTPVGAP